MYDKMDLFSHSEARDIVAFFGRLLAMLGQRRCPLDGERLAPAASQFPSGANSAIVKLEFIRNA